MSYCLNPNCQRAASNPVGVKFCQSCGSRLLLQERYRALELIGQGSFGRTFLAVDENQPSKPRCVIKQFFPQDRAIANTEKAAKLFEQEAVRLEMLGKHPQIPQFLAHFEEDRRQYLVQEFIDGANLAQVLETEGSFGESQIRDLLNSLLPVIQFIHSQNVIHRDIKPENIIRRSALLREETVGEAARRAGGDVEARGDRWVLVDFGAAKYATGTALVRTGTVIGSAGYAAPEQAGGKAVYASDLYSLGVTCLHLLTQAEPFDLYSFSEATWVWRDYLRRPVSRQLGEVFDKMVEIATSWRYQSASEVLNDLNSPPNRSTRTSRVSSGKSTPKSPRAASPRSVPASDWSIQDWRYVYTLQGHSSSIRSLAISPNGEILISGSDDKTIKLWQLSTGRELFTLKGHTKSVYSVAISQNGRILASGSDDKTIKLWQLSTGRELGTITLGSFGSWFSGDSGCVYSVAISPDGQTLASLSSGGTIKLWNLKTGREIRTFKGHAGWVYSITICPYGQLLAAGCDDSTVKVWNLKTGRHLRTLKGHSSWVYAVAFSPDGQMLCSGSDDTTVKLWDLKTARAVCTLTGHSQSVYSVAFNPVSALYSAGGDRKVPTTPLTEEFQTNQQLEFMQILASSSDDATVKLWDAYTGEELCTLRGHTSWVHGVAFSPDGRILASGGGDNIISVWQCD